MSVKLNILRKLVRELIKRELEEATMTGNIDGGAGPPKTPKAFKKKKKGQDESGFQDGHADPTVATTYRKVKESVNESRVSVAKEGKLEPFAKAAIKQLQNLISFHKKGKNEKARQMSRDVYTELEYMGMAFKVLGESVNEVAIRPSDKLIANKRWQMSQLDIEKALLKDKKVAKHIGKADIDIYFDDNELVAGGDAGNTIVAVKNNWTLDDLKKAILKQNPKKWQESITINGKKYKRLNENNQSWAKYYSWRNDKSMTPKQKIGMSMREVRDSLQELEKIVFRSIKLKKELKVGSDNYWKSTHSALRRIHERLVKLTGKIANLY